MHFLRLDFWWVSRPGRGFIKNQERPLGKRWSLEIRSRKKTDGVKAQKSQFPSGLEMSRIKTHQGPRGRNKERRYNQTLSSLLKSCLVPRAQRRRADERLVWKGDKSQADTHGGSQTASFAIGTLTFSWSIWRFFRELYRVRKIRTRDIVHKSGCIIENAPEVWGLEKC